MQKELEENLKPSDSLLDDLFSTQEKRDDDKREKVIQIPIIKIDDFPNHPFLVRNDEAMQDMAESIKTLGVQTPAIVRQKEDGRYELISGHRRKRASETVGFTELPCIVRNLSDIDAVFSMIDSNKQREIILPSEKAKSYKMRLDAMNQQGKRTDLTSVENQQRSKGITSRQLLSEKTGDSQDKIRNFVRLNELIPQILNMVDNSVIQDKSNLQIAMRPAVELSYLTKEQQTVLLEEMVANDSTPSHDQAIRMRKVAEEGKLGENEIRSIMLEAKPNQMEQFKISMEKLGKFFAPDTPPKKIEETIMRALETLRKRERNRSGEAR